MKWLVAMLVVVCGGPLAMAGGLWLWGGKSLDISRDTVFEVPAGITLDGWAQMLKRRGVISSPLLLESYVRIYGDFSQVKAGRYRLPMGASVAAMMEIMTSGRTERVKKLSVTVVEGSTITQVAERLAALGLGSRQEVLAVLQEPQVVVPGEDKVPTLEGYLYPETYLFFDRMPTLQEVVARMTAQFIDELPQGYGERVQKAGLTLHEAVIFASLIEKETALEWEKPKVSEVIWNRLRRKIPLAIDATISYGIPDYDGDLTFKHLRDKNNPYNSRVHRGLPPGPIGAVTRLSLQAVLRPTQEGYLYYVLKPGGSLEHQFTKTLRDHNRYVQKLLRGFR